MKSAACCIGCRYHHVCHLSVKLGDDACFSTKVHAAAAAIMLGVLDPRLIYLLLVSVGWTDDCRSNGLEPISYSSIFLSSLDSWGFLLDLDALAFDGTTFGCFFNDDMLALLGTNIGTGFGSVWRRFSNEEGWVSLYFVRTPWGVIALLFEAIMAIFLEGIRRF